MKAMNPMNCRTYVIMNPGKLRTDYSMTTFTIKVILTSQTIINECGIKYQHLGNIFSFTIRLFIRNEN